MTMILNDVIWDPFGTKPEPIITRNPDGGTEIN